MEYFYTALVSENTDYFWRKIIYLVWWFYVISVSVEFEHGSCYNTVVPNFYRVNYFILKSKLKWIG